VLVIRRGRLVTQAPVEQLLAGGGPGLVLVSSADDASLLGVIERAGLTVAPSADGLRVAGATPGDIGRLALEAGIALTGLSPVTADLEDVFMELTRGGGIA
jgi:ABC-2 type transport system ATP-binding protein